MPDVKYTITPGTHKAVLGAVPPRFSSIFTYFTLKMNENLIFNMKTDPKRVKYVCFKHFL